MRARRLVPGRVPDVLDGRLFGDDQPCFGCAPSHPIGFKLAFDRTDEGVETRFVPSENYQGPPGVMHGGLVMAFADEIAAWSIIAGTGTFGFTSSVECRLKKPVFVGKEVVGRGRIVEQTRRVVKCAVTILQDDVVACEATLKFVLLDADAAEKLLGRPLPDRWREFGR